MTRGRQSTYGIAEPVQLSRFSARLYTFTDELHDVRARARALPQQQTADAATAKVSILARARARALLLQIALHHGGLPSFNPRPRSRTGAAPPSQVQNSPSRVSILARARARALHLLR